MGNQSNANSESRLLGLAMRLGGSVQSSPSIGHLRRLSTIVRSFEQEPTSLAAEGMPPWMTEHPVVEGPMRI